MRCRYFVGREAELGLVLGWLGSLQLMGKRKGQLKALLAGLAET